MYSQCALTGERSGARQRPLGCHVMLLVYELSLLQAGGSQSIRLRMRVSRVREAMGAARL